MARIYQFIPKVNIMNKILYISPFNIYPPVNGGSRYIYNYLQALTKTNNLVYFGLEDQQTFPLNKKIKQYNVFPSGIRKYLDPLIYWKAFTLAQKERPNKIIVAMPYQIFFALFLARFQKSKCYLHEQNIEFLRFKRLGKWWWSLMYLYELIGYLLIDKILYISETDKFNIIKYFKTPENKLISSPYLVDTNSFKPNDHAREKIRNMLGLINNPLILFFGPLDYQPNKEALKTIVTSIAPQVNLANKKARFLIVGKNPPKNNTNPNIIFTGIVEKIEDYINASDVVIVPLHSGGGVRTKILESLACKKLVISTSIGAEGIPLPLYDSTLFIHDDLTNFNKQIIAILK